MGDGNGFTTLALRPAFWAKLKGNAVGKSIQIASSFRRKGDKEDA
jgi:hypothetical protein